VVRHADECAGPTLEQIDRDGALQEAIGSVYGRSRADLLRSAALGGSALHAALTAPPVALGKRNRDVPILQFALTFERLQASFYTEAARLDAISRESGRWTRVIGAHERAHVRIIEDVLGRAAGPSPFFDFHGVTEDDAAYTKTAVAMEDLTTALLIGQLPALTSRALVSAFFSLLSVEARHAAWVRHTVGVLPVAMARDAPRSLAEVGRLVQSTHFIARPPRTTSRKRPPFTG